MGEDDHAPAVGRGPNLDLGFGAIEGMTSLSNFNTSGGRSVCNSRPITSFTPIANVFPASGTYMPYNRRNRVETQHGERHPWPRT